ESFQLGVHARTVADRVGCDRWAASPSSEDMSIQLPIVSMRAGVLFPGMSLPIMAVRPQTLRAIEAALRDPEHRVIALAQRDDADDVSADNLFATGTIPT